MKATQMNFTNELFQNKENVKIKPNSTTQLDAYPGPVYTEEFNNGIRTIELKVDCSLYPDLTSIYMHCGESDDGCADLVGRVLGKEHIPLLCCALKKAAQCLENYRPQEMSKKEKQEITFNNYINELCDYRKENGGKLTGFSKEVGKKYKVTHISRDQFYQAKLHEAKGKIPIEYTNILYGLLNKKVKLQDIPYYIEETSKRN